MVLFSGFVYGLWTDRWQSSQALEEALERVSLVPMTVGDWRAEDLDVDPEMFAAAGAQKYWMRQYRQEATGEVFSVILMCGRGGKMAVHTPDVCYRGAGYEQVGSSQRLTIPLADSAPAEFWTGNFMKGNSLAAGKLRLYWTWGAAGRWQAPDVPRFTFRGQPALFKLYVIHQTDAEAAKSDAAVPFLQQLMPQMGTILFNDLPP
jgi:hypothetical protein